MKRDLLLEEKFIKWRLLRTKELDNYWDNFRKNNPDLSQELDIAIIEFDSLKFETTTLSPDDKQKILNAIISKTYKKNKIRIFIQTTAAIGIIGLFIAIFFNTNNNTIIEENTIIGLTLPEEDVYIISGNNKTTLTNNSNLELTKEKEAIIIDNKKEIQKVNLSSTTMNRLVVPYGKRSNITLSDGTRIWLNSGTQLDFPSEFIGETRDIKVNGEVYIEVKEDKNKPFIVSTNRMSIKVHATTFNVTAYDEDITNSVVLVEGKVGVKTLEHPNETFINPNEKLELSEEGITTEVVDVTEYISWTRDVLQFDETPISEILKKIGRYYNVQFKNSSDIILNKQTCSGKLFLSNNLDSVMTSISALSSTEYERDNNIIHIRKNNKPMIK